MKTLKLADDFYWAGIVDKELRVFDIIMETEFGASYNSYVLKGESKTAIFETAKVKFFNEYLDKLTSLVDVKNIDYIVVNHTEPDHAGSIEKLINMNPEITVVGTAMAVNFLKNITNMNFKSLVVKDGDTLDLGGKTLKFIVVPNLHWPDTMYTYIEELKTLVTCDSFGSHYGFDDVLRSKVQDIDGYMRAAKYYFDNIIGPFKRFMLKAIDRIEQIDVDMICPGHGPVLDSNLKEFIETYKNWSTYINPNAKKTVVIPYVSAYGYTEMLAEAIKRGIETAGDIDVRMYDMVTAQYGEVMGEIGNADGILFGSPTILGEALKPIWDLLSSMFPPVHGGKLASAFGSYGWSGEAVPHLMERIKQLRLKAYGDGFKVKFKPSDDELKQAEEFGAGFGKELMGN